MQAALHQCPPHLRALQLLPDDQSRPRSPDCHGLNCDLKSHRDNMSFQVFCTNLRRAVQVRCMLSLKQKRDLATTQIFWQRFNFAFRQTFHLSWLCLGYPVRAKLKYEIHRPGLQSPNIILMFRAKYPGGNPLINSPQTWHFKCG